MQNEKPVNFDYTMMSTFLVCRKKYYWRIVRGITGKRPPTAAEFGRCIHLALNEWHTHRDEDKAVKVFLDSFIEDPEDSKRTKAVGKKLLELYCYKYAHEGFSVLSSELPFLLPVPGTNIKLSGRIDKIIKWDDVLYIMDHKTTSMLGPQFFYKIKPNMQFDGYIWAANQLGYICNGVVLDALLVAKGLTIPAQLSKLTPLARDISERTPEDIVRYIRNVKLITEDIYKCYETDVWYENTESCCDFIECPYRKICKEDPSIHEQIIEMDYKVEFWDPLKEVKSAQN